MTPRRPLRALRPAAAALLLAAVASACIDDNREQEIGDRLAAEVNAQVPLVRDAPVVRYVTQVGALVARHGDRPDLRYRFYVIDSDDVNAFALPGGHVYVNRGLIERTENVSQLAGVLAHEVGHVAARHGVRALERQLRTGSASSVLYRLLLGGKPEILENDAVRIGGALWNASHSREAEEEADRLAVEYLVRSGIDPGGIVVLLERLLDEERHAPTAAVSPWFSTHPTTRHRVTTTETAIRDELEDTGAPLDELARNNASYPSFLARIRRLPPPPAPMGWVDP